MDKRKMQEFKQGVKSGIYKFGAAVGMFEGGFKIDTLFWFNTIAEARAYRNLLYRDSRNLDIKSPELDIFPDKLREPVRYALAIHSDIDINCRFGDFVCYFTMEVDNYFIQKEWADEYFELLGVVPSSGAHCSTYVD